VYHTEYLRILLDTSASDIYPEEGCRDPRNERIFLTDYTVSHPRRRKFLNELTMNCAFTLAVQNKKRKQNFSGEDHLNPEAGT
jgi:hypothetical protein